MSSGRRESRVGFRRPGRKPTSAWDHGCTGRCGAARFRRRSARPARCSWHRRLHPGRRVRALPALLCDLHLADQLAVDRPVPLHRARELPAALPGSAVQARGHLHHHLHGARDTADLPGRLRARDCCCAQIVSARAIFRTIFFLPFVVGLTTESFMFAIELQPARARSTGCSRTSGIGKRDAGLDRHPRPRAVHDLA